MNRPATLPSTPRQGFEPMGPASVVLALLTAAGWGCNGVATRFAVDTLPPMLAASARFALASVFMFGWCMLAGGIGVNRSQIRPILILGVLMFVQIATFNVGTHLSNASHATMLINTATFWVLLIEHFLPHAERLTRRKLTGVLVACFGTAIVLATSRQNADASQRDNPSFTGDLILVASSIILAGNILYTRHMVRTLEPNKLIFWQDLVAMFLLGGWALATEDVHAASVPAPTFLALLYQGIVVGGLCFAVQAQLLKRHSAVRVVVFSFAAPLFGFVLAALVRDDPLSPWLFAAVLFLAWGIIMVNRPN